MNDNIDRGVSRRRFVGTAGAGIATIAASPAGSARAQTKPRYTRYNVTSAKGQDMLASYAIAVEKLMKLPPDDPRNWFRNAFVHTLDCPHGNWWFFDWHRGYMGWFEQTLRDASGNPDFAIPYWDWTQLPEIPAGMFKGVLDPSNPEYDPYIKDFGTFYNYINPSLAALWKGFDGDQLAQLKDRMMPTLESLWAQVVEGGWFAPRPYARYLTAANPQLSANTKTMVTLDMVMSGLEPIAFSQFNSQETPTHNTQPTSGQVFGILEGNPHNKVHNNIGGYDKDIPPPPFFGFMANNLSPVDPIFFLHHSNMDRLWDVWTRKQQHCHFPTLPSGASLEKFQREPFLFFMNSQGHPVSPSTAKNYIDIGSFAYDYEAGSGEQILAEPCPVVVSSNNARFAGKMAGGVGSVAVPEAALRTNAAAQTHRPLVVQVTVPHPASVSAPREFTVLVNAPAGTTDVSSDSPYYVGTISFFGFMPGMTGDATFTLPLPRNVKAANGVLNVQVIPAGGTVPASAAAPKASLRAAPVKSVLKAVAVRSW